MVRRTLIAVMSQLSCYTGKEVTWEQASTSGFHYPPRPEDCHDGMEPAVTPQSGGGYPTCIPGRTTFDLKPAVAKA